MLDPTVLPPLRPITYCLGAAPTQAYLRRSESQVLTSVEAVLGIFQKLVASRATEDFAFQLLSAVVLYAPLYVVRPRPRPASHAAPAPSCTCRRPSPAPSLQSRVCGMRLLWTVPFLRALPV